MTHNKMPSSDMDMDLILTLDALLRDQNITHAAARLGISQPAMLEPTTFNAHNSTRTFVIALHENPALMLGAELQNQISSAAPGIRLRFRSRKPRCCQRRWKMAMWIFMSALTRGRTMHGSDASCLTMNMPQPSEKAIRAVRGRWIWKAIVAFPTWWFHPRATRSRALSISIWRGLATSVTW